MYITLRSILAATVSAALAIAGGACADDPEPVEIPDQYRFGTDERPAEILLPIGYDHIEPVPLLVVLHGYSASGFAQLAYTGLRDMTEQGFLVIAPDGTVDSTGNQFWNATDACCDFDGTGVDDVAYLTDLIEELRSVFKVDDRRIYLFGHSNGGFMSYRMACERADTIAAIVSLAGATYLDPAACDPSQAVSVLQIHGEDDDTVPYAGTEYYPSATDGVQRWADYNGCTGALTDGERRDVESRLDGSETRTASHEGCPEGIGVEVWSIEEGAHLPILHTDFPEQIATWLNAHPKPL